MKPTKYTPDFYISKLSKIPSTKWCVGRYTDHNGNHCVLGHLGSRAGIEASHTPASDGLFRLVSEFIGGFSVSIINDRPTGLFQQKTPKQRIIAALRFIKKKQEQVTQ